MTIVVAAYNEAGNIGEVVARCRRYGRVLMVDDASVDGTGEIACQAGASVLRHATNTHIKQAFVDGFRQALTWDAEYIVQMDAGLSHDPDEVPRLLEPLRRGVDVTIGSRFVEGGRLINQSVHRRLLSQWGSALVRATTTIPVVDLTSGFKGYRSSVLRRLDSEGVLDGLHSHAHAFQFELTNEVYRRGFTIEEVPITYRAGGSSLNGAVILEAVYICLRLLMRRGTG